MFTYRVISDIVRLRDWGWGEGGEGEGGGDSSSFTSCGVAGSCLL